MARPTTAPRRGGKPAEPVRPSRRKEGSTPNNADFAADDLAAASEFARSVGGIDKAQDLLRHLKNAKEAAPMHRDGL